MTYHILADQCTGCGDCMDECEEDAIQGKPALSTLLSRTNAPSAAPA